MTQIDHDDDKLLNAIFFCRLYTQLEILKNKTLRQDNPHISKRRGGRKAGHRRFSLQVSD